ncbi:hypothetical protein AUJ77_01660 [Candidatus Nomurabacteria bacterium CG1_02_43_90]|uniref:Uncharacterized protein n=1 Tax=Candidatus Nomurabacteria bacterium CG1_02_43_90 TaxID=1805281 RepID=A0A1J4V0Y8_9BACT|nr:MAG: hypothetical protein AUJ77_01660 [Candidatus Nomurabacteria bacterium CG1_02_43_90]
MSSLLQEYLLFVYILCDGSIDLARYALCFLKNDIITHTSNQVQFDVDFSPSTQQKRTESKLVQWVIRNSGGIIRDNNQANYVLLGFVALLFVASLFLIFRGDNNANEKAPARGLPPPTTRGI